MPWLDIEESPFWNMFLDSHLSPYEILLCTMFGSENVVDVMEALGTSCRPCLAPLFASSAFKRGSFF